MSSGSYQRLFSVARKELIHIVRDSMTLFFTLFLPVMQMFMLGYAIDTNVRHVRWDYPRQVPSSFRNRS